MSLYLSLLFQCEHLVNLLLDTAVLSMPASGVSQRNMVSFSHGEYFYSLFSEAINTELLKNLDLVVLELMKSSVDNPKMVMKFLFFIFTFFYLKQGLPSNSIHWARDPCISKRLAPIQHTIYACGFIVKFLLK